MKMLQMPGDHSIGRGQDYSIAISASYDGVPLDELVARSFGKAISHRSKLTPAIRNIGGMSGQMYRSFINNLVGEFEDARYLEIGSWAGSTATAALYGNSAKCICIDNWSEFGGPKEAFFANMMLASSEKVDFRFIEEDFRKVDYSKIGLFNIYMFDGPHEERDQYDGVVLVQSALEKSYVLIVDDWNWTRVRSGTLQALTDTGSRIGSSIEVRTSLDNSQPEIRCGQSWHNGYFIGVIHKP